MLLLKGGRGDVLRGAVGALALPNFEVQTLIEPARGLSQAPEADPQGPLLRPRAPRPHSYAASFFFLLYESDFTCLINQHLIV